MLFHGKRTPVFALVCAGVCTVALLTADAWARVPAHRGMPCKTPVGGDADPPAPEMGGRASPRAGACRANARCGAPPRKARSFFASLSARVCILAKKHRIFFVTQV